MNLTNKHIQKTIHPWDAARKMKVVRGNHIYPAADLDDGVKFFVLALEALGAKPLFSCEGHPTGFYVNFLCDMALAREINSLGYFTVELDRNNFNGFTIRFRMIEDTEREKRETLRMAAQSWVDHFGSRIAPALAA